MLEVTKVSRSLDRKSLFMWLEIADIFVLVTMCSLLNLAFGTTAMKVYLVYLPTIITAITLILGKRGKPDRFLLHLLKYHIQPKHLSCFSSGQESFGFSRALSIKQERARK